MAKRKTVKKSRKTNDKHHWDETLVIAVLVASALSILLLLASYISVTGQAYSSIPSREGVLNVLSGAVVVEGSGKAKCTVQCKNVGQICILAHQNDLIVDCDTKIVGSYNCLCSGIEKVIGTVPESPTQESNTNFNTPQYDKKIIPELKMCQDSADCEKHQYCNLGMAAIGKCTTKKTFQTECIEDYECSSNLCESYQDGKKYCDTP